jgi:hypothetical protein
MVYRTGASSEEGRDGSVDAGIDGAGFADLLSARPSAALLGLAAAAFGSGLMVMAGFRFGRTARVERAVLLAAGSSALAAGALGFFMMDLGSSFAVAFLSFNTLGFCCGFATVFAGSSATFEFIFVDRVDLTGSAICTFRGGLVSSVFVFVTSVAAPRAFAVDVAPPALLRAGFAAVAGASPGVVLDWALVRTILLTWD